MNSANDRYGASLDRPPGAGKAVDPATRLSELLAQSLEELTRPFDPPRPGLQPSRPAEPRHEAPPAIPPPHQEPSAETAAEPIPEQGRLDTDKALAELEAELFAAAKQVDRDASISPHEEYQEHAEDHAGEQSDKHLDEFERALLEPLPEQGDAREKATMDEAATPLAPEARLAEPAADASGV